MSVPTHPKDQEKSTYNDASPKFDYNDAPPAFDDNTVLEGESRDGDLIDYKTLSWWYVTASPVMILPPVFRILIRERIGKAPSS